MATIVLSAVGAAVGASVGGGVLGLSSVVIGRAIGATLGQVIDNRLLGGGSDPVETGRVDRLRLTGASEGAGIAQVYGRMRLAGQVIWALPFEEHVTRSGGKGMPAPVTRDYSYTISLAVALCEGEITRVGRIWADGTEIDRESLTIRVYPGSEDQVPDPLIEAAMGTGAAPAFRGAAYVVVEDLDVTRFGNRVPVLNFEVMRPEQPDQPAEIARGAKAVALIPGTGEYALATSPVYVTDGLGNARAANVSTASGRADFEVSLEALTEELPNCRAVSLVVSWFGDDLRCGSCSVTPRAERLTGDGEDMPWRVAGLDRAAAGVVPMDGEDLLYGGTPTDASVLEALAALNEAGQGVTFYPFLLMEQVEGNTLPDPYSGGAGQAHLPWRGRITTSLAPGMVGTPDGTATAEAEVAAFFGTAVPGDFTVSSGSVTYTGPDERSYRRFILHYAALCAAAGGVEAFLIGSELRGLTRIRGAGGSFPAVEALRTLAADCRAILGPEVRIGYAADWSEYGGYQTPEGDLYFHLDALWADENIDFIGIDNYMPLADWRDGDDHADAHWGTIYNLDYLKENIAGGEGFDWYYHAPEAEAVQLRSGITDGAYGEPWVWRVKDLRSWWENDHHDRPGGVLSEEPTAWVPGSKPIWFTELGCAAIDKGANQPNRFWDPKSSESGLPKYSTGRRDDYMQMQVIRAHNEYWAEDANNPADPVSGHRMVDTDRIYLWAWDARPFPAFPGRDDLWSDGGNYARGHWLNGRASNRSLGSVVREICARSGVTAVEDSGLSGLVRGYGVADVGTGRAALQPLMLAYGAEAAEREGVLAFFDRDGREDHRLVPDMLAISSDLDGTLERSRAPEAEMPARIRLVHVEAEGDYETRVAQATFPQDDARVVSTSEMPLVLTAAEAAGVTERWLAEARVARDRARFALPPSRLDVMAGDVVTLDGAAYRIDHVEQGAAQILQAVRVEPGLFTPSDATFGATELRAFTPAVPVLPVFLDLPLMAGDELPHAPHIAVTATPWPGAVAVYDAPEDAGYGLNTLLPAASLIGTTETALLAASPGRFDTGAPLRLRVAHGALSSLGETALLSGGNLAAIGDGRSDTWELFQFRDAVLVDDGLWELSMRLRGQAGTDGVMPAAWPIGSTVVLIDSTLRQLDLVPASRGLARHYRIGPAARAYDDPAYRHRVEAFAGIGLRPYAPAHLRAKTQANGDLDLTWIRRTRIDGDSWEAPEVPLGEDIEAYLLRVLEGETIKREEILTSPDWTYTIAQQSSDAIAPPYSIAVAQISQSFGPGPFSQISIDT